MASEFINTEVRVLPVLAAPADSDSTLVVFGLRLVGSDWKPEVPGQKLGETGWKLGALGRKPGDFGWKPGGFGWKLGVPDRKPGDSG